MKPYFKFSLPSIDVNPLEHDLWLEVSVYCAVPYNFEGSVVSCPHQHGNIPVGSFFDKKYATVPLSLQTSLFRILNISDRLF
jgi:hypothetical protein